MNQEQAKKLLINYKQGKCTKQEVALLHRWYVEQGRQLDSAPDLDNPFSEELMLWQRIVQGLEEPVDLTTNTNKLYWQKWIPYVAAVLISVIGFVIYFKERRVINTSSVIENKYVHDIAPGANKATLMLTDGKIISLSSEQEGLIIDEGILKYNDGTLLQESLAATSSHQELQLSTPAGGQYQITLPDGTKVWLNAASSITYVSSSTASAYRKVHLQGEAYFEVASVYDGTHKLIPFFVESDGQQIEVLGTHFNVSAYPDDPSSQTTLIEGLVKVSNSSGKSVYMKPNQQIVRRGQNVTLLSVNAEEALAWKNGEFMFYEESLESIMRKLQRWYQVEVVFDDDSLRDQVFMGVVSRFSNISKVLSKLELTGDAQFKIEGNTIIVSRKNR